MTSEPHGAAYLDEIESRQDEVLRLLTELEARIERSLTDILAERPPEKAVAQLVRRAAA